MPEKTICYIALWRKHGTSLSWLKRAKGSRDKDDFESFQVSLILLPGYLLVLDPIK